MKDTNIVFGAIELTAAISLLWYPVAVALPTMLVGVDLAIPLSILYAMPFAAFLLGLDSLRRIGKLFSWNEHK